MCPFGLGRCVRAVCVDVCVEMIWAYMQLCVIVHVSVNVSLCLAVA